MFDLNDEELTELYKWDDDHKLECEAGNSTIGGRLTYCFTPTGLGIVKVVKCACGKEINITKEENW